MTYGPDDIDTDELIDRVLTRMVDIAERDYSDEDFDMEGLITDLQVNMGYWDNGVDAAQWLEVADAIYEEHDISDEEYHAALCRVLKPGEDIPSEPASSFHSPAHCVPLELTGELVYEALGAEPAR